MTETRDEPMNRGHDALLPLPGRTGRRSAASGRNRHDASVGRCRDLASAGARAVPARLKPADVYLHNPRAIGDPGGDGPGPKVLMRH